MAGMMRRNECASDKQSPGEYAGGRSLSSSYAPGSFDLRADFRPDLFNITHIYPLIRTTQPESDICFALVSPNNLPNKFIPLRSALWHTASVVCNKSLALLTGATCAPGATAEKVF